MLQDTTTDPVIKYFEEAQQLLDLINTQSGNVNNLWSIYSVVLFGLASLIASNSKIRQSGQLKNLIGLFIIFALSNLYVIYKAQHMVYSADLQLNEMLQIKEFVAQRPFWTKPLAEISASPAWLIALFHLVLDVFAVVIMVKLHRKASEAQA